MNVKVIDAIMGSGKSTWAIKYIKKNPKKHYMIVVPYLTEIERYKEDVDPVVLYSPVISKRGSKYEDLFCLIKEHKNIVTTHQLFLKFETTLLTEIKEAGYTVIIDEALNIFEKIEYPTSDIAIFQHCGLISSHPETGRLTWNEAFEPVGLNNYGNHRTLKTACKTHIVFDPNKGELTKANNTFFIKCLSPTVFDAFDEVFILTFLWDGSFHKVYFDLVGIEYQIYSISEDQLITYSPVYRLDQASQLISIIEDDKLNQIGVKINGHHNPLSAGWYHTHRKDEMMQTLRKNILNFFKNISHTPSKENMWTTFTSAEMKLRGNGYSGGKKNICFLPLNIKGTNAFMHKTALAYTVNIFINPCIRKILDLNHIEADEDSYALSEMLQWIWRSAIRVGQPITLYIPSERMRGLLINWLQNSQ